MKYIHNYDFLFEAEGVKFKRKPLEYALYSNLTELSSVLFCPAHAAKNKRVNNKTIVFFICM